MVTPENLNLSDRLYEAVKEAKNLRPLNPNGYAFSEFFRDWRYDYEDAQLLGFTLEELKETIGFILPPHASMLVIGGVEGMPFSRLPTIRVVACDPVFTQMPPVPSEYTQYTEIAHFLNTTTSSVIWDEAKRRIPNFNGFDVVTSRFVIDYLYRAYGEFETMAFVHNTHRLLRPGGLSLQNWGGAEEILVPKGYTKTMLSYLAFQKQ